MHLPLTQAPVHVFDGGRHGEIVGFDSGALELVKVCDRIGVVGVLLEGVDFVKPSAHGPLPKLRSCVDLKGGGRC